MTVVHVKMEGAGLALQGSTRIDGLEGMCSAGMRSVAGCACAGGDGAEENRRGGGEEEVDGHATEVAIKWRRGRGSPRQVDDAGGNITGTPRGQTITLNMGMVIYTGIANTVIMTSSFFPHSSIKRTIYTPRIRPCTDLKSMEYTIKDTSQSRTLNQGKENKQGSRVHDPDEYRHPTSNAIACSSESNNISSQISIMQIESQRRERMNNRVAGYQVGSEWRVSGLHDLVDSLGDEE